MELVNRFSEDIETIFPPAGLKSGYRGHAWEQFILPLIANNRLLWSPANTGPLLTRRQVITLHDLSTIEHPELFATAFSGWYRFLLPRLARRAASVITISEFTKSRMVDLWDVPSEKVFVTQEGINPRFAPVECNGATSGSLDIPSQYYLLALGSLEPRKNLSRLLRARDSIQASLPEEIWLVLASARGKEAIFKDIGLASLPARVHLAGYVADEALPTLYSGALAFIYASLYEGFGLPPLEAMACGVPVLTSNTTSIPEVVGDAALLVDPCNVEAIADGIRRLVENTELRDNLRKRGLARARQFTREKCAEKTWRVLLDVGDMF